MKGILRLLGAAAALCGVILLLTLTFAIAKLVWFGKSSESRKGHVAVVDVSGIILSSYSTVKEIRELEENSGVKAVVVRINSPGGLVAPSQEIFEALKSIDKKVPVIISMNSLAASGGYYIALGGRKIYANPGSITASIGVIMEFANLSKLYNWAKVERYVLKAGKFKDVGSELRDMTPEEKELLNKFLTDVHQQFKTAVRERRKMTVEEVDAIADGRIMTGSQAKTAKLVDALGGFEDAVKEAKKVAGLSETAPVIYPEKPSNMLRKIILGEEGSETLSRLTEVMSEASSLGLNSGWHVLLLSPVR
jgi:protease-4